MPREYSHWDDAYHSLRRPNLSISSHIQPHTQEAGDSYYIGDVYEPSRIGQTGELVEEHLLSYKFPAPYVSKLPRTGWYQADGKQSFKAIHEIPGVSCSRMATYLLSRRLHESDHSSAQTEVP